MAAMFSKTDDGMHTTSHTTSGSTTETIIGPTVRVEGTFNSEDNMQIAGEVKGSIETTQDIRVEESATIEANIQASNIRIAGEVKGDVTASGRVELTSSAKVFGNITTQIISIDTGAVLQGQCTTVAADNNPAADEDDE